MRARLTFAIVAVVAATLLVATIGSLFLIRRAAVTTAEQQLNAEADFIGNDAGVLAPANAAGARRVMATLKAVGNYSQLQIVGLSLDGTFSGSLGPVLNHAALPTATLLAGGQVSGTVAGYVYVLIPLELNAAQQARLDPPIATDETPVLVATHVLHKQVGGVAWFIVLGLASLALATAVAFYLARRFTRPLVEAVEATEKIAGGDLGVRLHVTTNDVPELAELGTAINAMSDALVRAQDQQRQFLLSVSHELRTPLTSIRGYAEGLADGTIEGKESAYNVIIGESLRLERLVRDLLVLGQLDARRFTLELGPSDVGPLLDRAVESWQPEAQANGLEIGAARDGAPLVAVADADRFAQILSNLLENALGFARHRVVVRGDVQGPLVVVTVTDDGPGIPSAQLAQVFTPHFTTDRGRRRDRGSGLGLAIVAELAEAMGGGARAESPADDAGGTRMVVWLPLARQG